MIDSNQDLKKLTLGHLLAKVSRFVGGRMRIKLEGIGLHHAQGMILFHLWRQDGIAQNVLAQALHITPPTATNTLQRMERDGWIERRRDAADQRIVRVYLTEKARALHAEAHTSFQELDRELTSVLNDKERDMFRESLQKIHHHLSQAVETCDRSCPRHRDPRDEGEENR